MRKLSDGRFDQYRIPHPMGPVPADMRQWVGCFRVPFMARAFSLMNQTMKVNLNIIASRGGGPAELYGAGENWDHVSVSTPTRTPTWEEMCHIKNLFFHPNETVMQLHPGSNVPYINNHPYCLHLWAPCEGAIPLPPPILVGLEELNPNG